MKEITTRKYQAIGIRTDWKNNTRNGAAKYSLLFCESCGLIRGPFIIDGCMVSYWDLRGQNTCGTWEIETRTTRSGREVIHKITKTTHAKTTQTNKPDALRAVN